MKRFGRIALLTPVMLASCPWPAQADTLYKCKDEETGQVLYTNQKGSAKNCIILSRDQPISTFTPPPRAAGAAKAPTPGDFPKVDGDTQKSRDGDRRKILEQELATEQQNLEKSRKDLAEQEAQRPGNEQNFQKAQERLQPYRDRVALHDRNVEALKRELATLK